MKSFYTEVMQLTYMVFFAIKKTHDKKCWYKSTQRVQISDKAAQIRDLESQYPDHSKNLINCSLYCCRAILTIASKCNHNLLSNGRISNWAVSMMIWIATKIKSLVVFVTPDPSIKVTDRQTNKHYQHEPPLKNIQTFMWFTHRFLFHKVLVTSD